MKSNGEHEKERKWQVTQQVASNLIVVAGGIVLYLTLNNLDVVKDVVGELIGILSPFMAGLVLAYLLDGLARFFQQKLLGKQVTTGIAGDTQFREADYFCSLAYSLIDLDEDLLLVVVGICHFHAWHGCAHAYES